MADAINQQDISREDIYSLLRQVTHAHYPEQVRQGYIWDTNTDLENVSEYVKRLESQGLEYILGEVAFDRRGERVPGLKAVLTRKRNHNRFIKN